MSNTQISTLGFEERTTSDYTSTLRQMPYFVCTLYALLATSPSPNRNIINARNLIAKCDLFSSCYSVTATVF